MGSSTRDSRECAHEACRSVGLYRSLSLQQFLARPCVELVEAERLTCPIGPSDYTDGLLKFRERYRSCLERRGYSGFAIYLQRLCDTGASWNYWCTYHAQRL